LPRISKTLLIRGIAYRLQEEASTGLSKLTRRRFKQLAKALRDRGTLQQQTPALKAGTKFIREWKGRVHEVVVAADSYIYAGKHYRSLSQIARTITGTNWSGPRFFGVEAARPRLASIDPEAVSSNAGAAASGRAPTPASERAGPFNG
jgi:spermidine synthase